MNKTLKTLTLLAAGAALALPVYAMDHSEMDHSKMDHSKMDHSAASHGAKAEETAAPAKSAMKGAEIRSTKVEGYQVKYQLIDMADMMKNMGASGMDPAKMKSHHLMVYFTGPDGKAASQGKVGYQVTGPDKNEQKTMGMAMNSGFGADVDLKAKGAYKIKTKAVFGDKTVVDEFTYTVK